MDSQLVVLLFFCHFSHKHRELLFYFAVFKGILCINYSCSSNFKNFIHSNKSKWLIFFLFPNFVKEHSSFFLKFITNKNYSKSAARTECGGAAGRVKGDTVVHSNKVTNCQMLEFTWMLLFSNLKGLNIKSQLYFRIVKVFRSYGSFSSLEMWISRRYWLA